MGEFKFDYGIITFKHRFNMTRSLDDYEEITLNRCIGTSLQLKYKTVAFVWIKRNKKTPSLFWGMGFWTRANAEICILATKGKPKRISAKVHQVIMSPIVQSLSSLYYQVRKLRLIMTQSLEDGPRTFQLKR